MLHRYVASYSSPLFTSLGGDACAEDSDEKAVPIGVEYYNTPERVVMVSAVCSFTCSSKGTLLCVIEPVLFLQNH